MHPRDDVERLYVSRREGGGGLASIEDSVASSILRLENSIQKEGWLQVLETILVNAAN